ncbi:protein FAM227A isoform X2 [Aquarana catesbeiana]|uniref:protein FAM227A isoform X2 n=1 Tax=Aquarana catesbeiana TaxID=8400 RepID=UPI003CCA2963
MDSINRLSSPMALCVEDFTEPPLEQEKRRESIKKAVQGFQAPFLIGSMEKVSQKITHLEEEIRAFDTHDLVIESSEIHGMQSPHEHHTSNYKVTGSSKLKKSEQIKERERKDLQRFTQEFQISMRNMKSAVYQQSHRNLKKPDGKCQQLLFDRVAENYVRLLDLCQKLRNGDAFLNSFPLSVSQTIYSSFCFSFPQSLHQFQSDDFKTQLCSVIWQWFGGICPTPGSYKSWDYDTLEPKDDMPRKKEKQRKDSSFFDLYPSKEQIPVTTCYNMKPTKNSKQKSHPTFCEPEFTCMAFNLNGHSPLMQYYLKKKKAESQAGINILVRRTELQKQ